MKFTAFYYSGTDRYLHPIGQFNTMLGAQLACEADHYDSVPNEEFGKWEGSGVCAYAGDEGGKYVVQS